MPPPRPRSPAGPAALETKAAAVVNGTCSAPEGAAAECDPSRSPRIKVRAGGGVTAQLLIARHATCHRSTCASPVDLLFSTVFFSLQVLHEDARIFLYERLLSEEECDHIIKIAEPRVQRSGCVASLLFCWVLSAITSHTLQRCGCSPFVLG